VINRSAPRAAVVPMVMYKDVRSAMSWLCRAFGFREALHYADPDGRITHGQLLAGEHEIMVGWPGEGYVPPASHGQRCQCVLVHVEDVDAHHRRSLAAGATIISAPETQPFGERSYEAEDCEGQRWFFSQHVADVPPGDWGATVIPG
jgi:PhnB protein